MKSANPVLDGTVDAPPAGPVAKARRLTVAVRAGGPERRWRAGLGPFTREPRTIEASAKQAEALAADPWLDLT